MEALLVLIVIILSIVLLVLAVKYNGKKQYFSQNSGSCLGNSAIVTQLFVIGAGFFQAVPLG